MSLAVVLVFSASIGQGKSIERSKESESKVRYTHWQASAEILAQIRELDTENRFEHDYVTDYMADYDYFFVFLKDWPDVVNFPYYREFLLDEHDVRRMSDNYAFKEFVYKLERNDDFSVVLLNIEALSSKGMTCHAKFIFDFLQNGHLHEWTPKKFPWENYLGC